VAARKRPCPAPTVTAENLDEAAGEKLRNRAKFTGKGFNKFEAI